MRFLPIAGLAATASAFLVVPESSSIDAESLPADVRESWSQTLNLECPGCPVLMPHTGELTTQMESHLEMKFDVDLEQGNRLLLNGFEVYPHANPFEKSLTAAHVVDMPDGAYDRKGMMRGGMMHSGSDSMMDRVEALGFSLASKTTPASQVDDNFDHIALDIHIIEVNNVFVDNIPSMHVNLVKDDSGMIAISSIKTGATETPSITQGGDVAAKCDSWLCEWIASLEDHWNHWRPHCGMGSKNHSGKSSHHVSGHHKGPHHNKPHHGKPHHSHHDEQYNQPEESPISSGKQRTWRQLMWSVTTHILLPVLIGIVAGVAMSLVGMAVGTVLVQVYRRFFRSSSCPYRHMAIPKVVVHEEKSGLMDNQEPPPSYEEGTGENVDSKV